jgi:hypothetical protein
MTGAPARPCERGQALTEYALLVAMVFVLFFIPVFPHPDTGERMSLFLLFVEVFDIYIDSFHTLIALPVP